MNNQGSSLVPMALGYCLCTDAHLEYVYQSLCIHCDSRAAEPGLHVLLSERHCGAVVAMEPHAPEKRACFSQGIINRKGMIRHNPRASAEAHRFGV